MLGVRRTRAPGEHVPVKIDRSRPMSFKAASAGFSFTGHPESIQLAGPLALMLGRQHDRCYHFRKDFIAAQHELKLMIVVYGR